MSEELVVTGPPEPVPSQWEVPVEQVEVQSEVEAPGVQVNEPQGDVTVNQGES